MLKFLLLFICITSQTWAQGSEKIENTIKDYFNVYQQADTNLIKKAFHSETSLLSVDEGRMEVLEMKDWLKGLEDRNARGDIRVGQLKIENIDVTHQTASVKLKIRFPKFEFTDYLSLLKVDGKWLIVGKIYHFREI